MRIELYFIFLYFEEWLTGNNMIPCTLPPHTFLSITNPAKVISKELQLIIYIKE